MMRSSVIEIVHNYQVKHQIGFEKMAVFVLLPVYFLQRVKSKVKCNFKNELFCGRTNEYVFGIMRKVREFFYLHPEYIN